MNQIPTDSELDRALMKMHLDDRTVDELRRDGKGYQLMQALKRIEIASQLAQQRLAELP